MINTGTEKDCLSLHKIHWHRFQEARKRDKLSQALLFVGAADLQIDTFAEQISRALLCKSMASTCGHCQSCLLMAKKEHPDFHRITPEKPGALIKIEQIRALHNLMFTGPQLGNHRIVLIHTADKMNQHAANALLKMLEEPPSAVYFLLLAEQISTILPTVLSRCQQWRFASAIPSNSNLDYFSMFPGIENSERSIMAAETANLIHGLLHLRQGKITACGLAEEWTKYPFHELIRLLSLICAEMIRQTVLTSSPHTVLAQQLIHLANGFSLIHMFMILDQLNGITRNLSHNININQLLSLEKIVLMISKGPE